MVLFFANGKVKLKLIYLDFWMPFIFITHVLNHITSDKRRKGVTKALLHYYYIVFALFVFLSAV